MDEGVLGLIRRMTIDHAGGVTEIELMDGRRVSAPLEDDQARDLGILRSSYDTQERTITLELGQGGVVVAEVGGAVPDEVRRAGRPVVYLDQLHWITLAKRVHAAEKVRLADRAACDRLLDLARSQQVILPLSAAHFDETSSARPRWRQDLVPLMLDLSRGWQMTSPLKVRRHELLSMFARYYPDGGVRPTAPAVFSLEPGIIFDTGEEEHLQLQVAGMPAELDDLFRRLIWVTSLYSAALDEETIDQRDADRVAASWADSHSGLAQHLRENPVARRHLRQVSLLKVLTDLGEDLPAAALVAGLPSDRFREWTMNHAEECFAAMPYLGAVREATDHRLRNAGDQWNSHDLHDLHSVGCASAYADAVASDAKAADYLNRAWRGREGGVPIVKSLPELVEHVDALLNARVKGE